MTTRLAINANDPIEGQTPEVIPGYGYGYKILSVDSYGNLRSVSRNDIWPPYEGLSAGEEPTLDNKVGIYVTDQPTAYDLKGYNRIPGQGATAAVTCMAKCQIWGKCVRHQNGYRAQHALPEEVWLQPDPNVPTEQVEKLAMAIRNKYAIDVQVKDYAGDFEEPPPRPKRQWGTPRQKRVYERAVNQQQYDALVSQGAKNIRIEGGQISLRRAGYGGTNVFIASGDIQMYDGTATAAGGTIQQFGGTIIARNNAKVELLGGSIRAGGGDGVVIEVHSQLKFIQASRNVGGGQTWRNNEGQVYFTRYWRGTVVNRGQQNAQALQQYLQDNGEWIGPEMKKNLEGLLRHHKYISHAFEQYNEADRHEVDGSEDWTRQGSGDRFFPTGVTELAPATASGSFYTDQQTVKCPNCAAEVDTEVCPNCGKGLSVEWQKANDQAIPFDHPPQGGTPENEFWTDVNPVPKQNWDKVDNSFPSMTSHIKTTIETGRPETPDDKVYLDGRAYGEHVAQYSVAELLEGTSAEQLDEIYRRVMNGSDDIWEFMGDENPLSGEMAGGPDIREIVAEAGDEIPDDENYGEWVDHYARIWTEGYHSGWLEAFEELLAQEAGKFDQAGTLTFPSEWTGSDAGTGLG